jgi:hypothetical protein
MVDYGRSSGVIQIPIHLHLCISIVLHQQYSADMEVRRKAISIVLSIEQKRRRSGCLPEETTSKDSRGIF